MSGKAAKATPSPTARQETARHLLVVGGTGMLAGAVAALAGRGDRISLVSRRASGFTAAPADAYDCDYHDTPAFLGALEAAIGRTGPVDLAIAWFHTLKIGAPRGLAARVGRPGRPGRLFQVLGSATADPSRPDRLQTAAGVAEGLPDCRLRQVVLGFVAEAGRSRWLTHAEISRGVLGALETDAPLTIVGQVEPWAARP